MPDYKVVIRYKFANKGWSEVFYRTDTTPVEAGNLTEAFITASLACRAPGVIMQSVTASNEALSRETSLKKLNRVAPGIAGAAPDVTNTAVRLNLNGDFNGTRKLWLRGLNDVWTIRDANGNTALAATLQTRIDTYIEKICVTEQLQMKRIDNELVNPWLDVGSVVGFTIQGKQWMQINVIGGHNLVIGDDIYLGGFPQTALGGAKGVFRVIAANLTDTVVVNYAWVLGATTISGPGMRIRKATYTYPDLIAGQIDDLSTHDTGVPTDRPRGRRSGLTVRR